MTTTVQSPEPRESAELAWYAQHELEDIYKKLHTSEHGLHTDEAHRRTLIYGHNSLTQSSKHHWVFDLLANFKNPLVLILLFAAIVSFALGQIVDAVIITIIVFFSAVLNFFQEYNAGRAAEKLREKVTTYASTIRDGHIHEIKIRSVTVGDIIQLNAGDIIPADARVITSKDFYVNQSSLTGESFPIAKDPEVVRGSKVSLTDMNNIVFSGSSVTTGTATIVVIQIGDKTEYGQIAAHLAIPQEHSEFTIGVRNFSILIMRITFFFVLFIFFINTFIKHTNLFESFTFAIAIAVGLTPELLPMIMSVTMARGSVRMAQKGVIVKKLAAIPDFGEMNVLCTDKTGTLTQDKIELIKFTDVNGEQNEDILRLAYLNSYFQTGIRNPMDDAVLIYKKEAVEKYRKVDEIPFDFIRKKMSVILAHGHTHLMVTKGAPEDVLTSCTKYTHGDHTSAMTTAITHKIMEQFHALSNDGFRVVAVATREIEGAKKSFEKRDEHDLVFAGFISFLDPPKKGVREVLDQLEQMGIEIKVVTGDNELVTQKICRDVNLAVKGTLLGRDIEDMTDERLRAVVAKTTIFARCTPNTKSRIIQALKDNGAVVGYMGDGINDAPSLKVANIGISVNNAVDVARESADLILTHKSLGELKDGVLEGRKTFGNTMKYIMMGISANFGNMFSVLGAVLFLPFFPMLPVQILVNNLLYDISQIAIPTDHVDEEYIRLPKKWDLTFIKKFMFTFGPISSAFDFMTFYVLYGVLRLPAGQFQTGWFLESIATQTLIIHIIRTRKIPFIQSTASGYLTLSTFAIVAIGWLLPGSPIGNYFGFRPMPTSALVAIIMIVATYAVVVELGKNIFYHVVNPAS